MAEYLLNTKCYKKSGNRVAVFGRDVSVGNTKGLEVFELQCSKKDAFSRKKARQIYELYLSDGVKEVEKLGFRPFISILEFEKDSAKYIFKQYCDKNFCKLQIVLKRIFVTEYKVGNKVIHRTSSGPKFY